MSSLFTDSEKAALVNDFKQVVDTFLRPLKVYLEPTKIIVVSNPDYNPYDDASQNSTDIQNVPVEHTIQGRILYDKNQEWSFINPKGSGGAEQLKLKDQTVRAVRVKVDADGYAILKDGKKFEIDGFLFNLESLPRPHGLFGVDYYTFYFVRSL